MDRPARKTKSKAVNYCEYKDFGEDDEDFACVKAPPHKKVKETLSQQDTKKSPRQEVIESAPSQRSRKPLDVKLYERDLEAAISLSMLNSSDKTSDQSPFCKENAKVLSPIDENQEPTSLHHSNCSVDSTQFGLDQITADSTALSIEKKEVADLQRIKHKTQDEDYQPNVASDSESDKDYSELESEDEEFIKKKTSKKNKQKVTSKAIAKQLQSTKKEKQPRMSKSTGASTQTRTPLATKNISESTSSASSSKEFKHAACPSPALTRIPKWVPPGQIGISPPSSKSPPVRSPSQGLRLGLSRLVRVKPLHPVL